MRQHSTRISSGQRRRLTGRLEVETEQGAFLGDTRIRLLEAIDTHGSISKAAKFVPISYKAAWDAVDTMNNMADKPLVTRMTGGLNGGGTRLTEYGHKVVELYRALEAEYQATLEHLTANMNSGEAGSLQEFRRLLKRMSLKSSARNQFTGTIIGLKAGEVDYEARLKLDDTSELVAIITRASAETMGLKMGMEAHALVKSSSVLLTTDRDARTTARNHLRGEVSHIHHDAVNAEVTLALPGGKSVCALVSNDSVRHMELAVGVPACAVFKASSVILCASG
ncbi:MAG: TOBE domain-containing protein [Zoogloeaceae bacterium]|jgi:molybdate transport system regulatory protein|nr:TOBE domain-containing protein [Zoogloeaceae bacterium]